MDSVVSWITEHLGLSPELQHRIFVTAIAVVVLWGLRRLALAVLVRRVKDDKSRYQWKKTTLYVAVVLGFFFVGRTWFEGFESVATYLGLVSAGLAVALKDPLANIAGWLFIIWRRPFDVGERIEIDGVAGDVIDIRVFQFSMLEIGNWVDADQSTGRIIHVPNSKIFTDEQANYSKGFSFIWNELSVLVTFESNWRRAKEILTRIADEHGRGISEQAEAGVRRAAQRYLIYYTKLEPIVYTSIKDSGIMLSIRYLCDVRNRRGSSQTLWEEILTAFAEEADIDFAYPTQRFYRNEIEGKPGTKPTE